MIPFLSVSLFAFIIPVPRKHIKSMIPSDTFRTNPSWEILHLRLQSFLSWVRGHERSNPRDTIGNGLNGANEASLRKASLRRASLGARLRKASEGSTYYPSRTSKLSLPLETSSGANNRSSSIRSLGANCCNSTSHSSPISCACGFGAGWGSEVSRRCCSCSCCSCCSCCSSRRESGSQKTRMTPFPCTCCQAARLTMHPSKLEDLRDKI